MIRTFRGVLLFCLVLTACAPFQRPLETSDVAAQLAEPNRLDKALASPQGSSGAAIDWQLSGLLSAGDRRLPLMILLRAAPEGSAQETPPQGVYEDGGPQRLEAMLLTETSLGLCALNISRRAVTVERAMPGSQIQNICERVGIALQRIFLTPMPTAYDQASSNVELRRPVGGGDLIFLFSSGGILQEKTARRNDQPEWTVQYTDAVEKGGFFIPTNSLYKEASWHLSLVRLYIKETPDG